VITPDEALTRVAEADRVWLFLDYDGTLAEFAPTPDHILPDPNLADLIRRLANHPALRVAVISGRRLSHIEQLLPVEGIWRAGTYGVELITPDGDRVDRLTSRAVRALLDEIKPRWSGLLAGRDGFYLEDKDWAIAIHAKDADLVEAEGVLRSARAETDGMIDPGRFRILGGDRFIEIGPRLAHKGKTVDYLLTTFPWQNALPVFLGDDDKDEEAFHIILEHDGLPIVVSPEPKDTAAVCRLPTPGAVRRWLEQLLSRL
jgi:trehalose-phosphatase